MRAKELPGGWLLAKAQAHFAQAALFETSKAS
jgi:hypothetical protein